MAALTKLEHFFLKKVGEAIASYNMIDDGDRILVAVSGGKDSFSVLKALRQKQGRLPIKYGLHACYVDMGMDDKAPRIIEDYLRKNGYDFTIEKTTLWKTKQPKGKKINCFWCAFNRRKKLFETADRLGCNKIAMGHHKDDIAETLLLNIFFNGELSTMLPKQRLFNGKFHVIRPLALCEERYIRQFAKEAHFPVIKSRCPNVETSKRRMMKDIIDMVFKVNPDVKTNIFRCMKRIKYDYLPG